MPVKELLTTMTARGQITVPAEVQRRLGLKPHDKVAFTIDAETDEVRLRPATFTLDSVFSSVAPATKTEDFKTLARDAWEDKATREGDKLQQP